MEDLAHLFVEAKEVGIKIPEDNEVHIRVQSVAKEPEIEKPKEEFPKVRTTNLRINGEDDGEGGINLYWGQK